MGTLWALRNLYSNIESDMVLSNGDTICDLDLRKFIKLSRSNRKLITVIVVRMKSPFGIAELDGNLLTKFTKKPTLPYYINGVRYDLGRDLKSHLNGKYKE